MVQKVQEGVENFQPLQKVGNIFNFEMLDARYDFVQFSTFWGKINKEVKIKNKEVDFLPYFTFSILTWSWIGFESN